MNRRRNRVSVLLSALVVVRMNIINWTELLQLRLGGCLAITVKRGPETSQKLFCFGRGKRSRGRQADSQGLLLLGILVFCQKLIAFI